MSFWVGIGFSVMALVCMALSIRTNLELVLGLRAYDRALYESLGEPRLIGYEWTAWPKNRAYSTWLRQVAMEPTSRYARRAKLLRVLRMAFYACWLAVMIIAFAS
jgi:hypothetical protein